MTFYGVDPKNVSQIYVSTPFCESDYLNSYTTYLISQLVFQKSGEFFDSRNIVQVVGDGPMIYGAESLRVEGLADFIKDRAKSVRLEEEETDSLRKVAVSRALSAYGNQDTPEALAYIEKLYRSFLGCARENVPERVIVIDVFDSRLWKNESFLDLTMNCRHYKLLVVTRVFAEGNQSLELEPSIRICYDLFVHIPLSSFVDDLRERAIIKFTSTYREQDETPSNTTYGTFFNALPLPYLPKSASKWE